MRAIPFAIIISFFIYTVVLLVVVTPTTVAERSVGVAIEPQRLLDTADDGTNRIQHNTSSDVPDSCQWVIGAVSLSSNLTELEGNGKAVGGQHRGWQLYCPKNTTRLRNESRLSCTDPKKVWHECSYAIPLSCMMLALYEHPLHQKRIGRLQPCDTQPRCQCRPGLVYNMQLDTCATLEEQCGATHAEQMMHLTNFTPLNYSSIPEETDHVELEIPMPEYQRKIHLVLQTPPNTTNGFFVGHDALVPGSYFVGSAASNHGYLTGTLDYSGDGSKFLFTDCKRGFSDGEPEMKYLLQHLGAHSLIYEFRDVQGYRGMANVAW